MKERRTESRSAMTLIEAVEQTIRKREVVLRINTDQGYVTISEWPSCMVCATGDTLDAALTQYLSPALRRKVEAGQR